MDKIAYLRLSSDAELEAELQRRKISRTVPPIAQNQDFSGVMSMVATAMSDLERSGRIDEDLESHVFEAICEAMYGPNFFTDWYNNIVFDHDPPVPTREERRT